jgi:predicted phage baseplate assembly protein
LLPISRGKTVPSEVLGSGDATRGRQEFVFAKSPLTYLPSQTASGGLRSTLRVWVSDIEWHEVPTLYGQPADARVFVTFEDDDGKTHVRFGDGRTGARLPSGRGNVIASYRHGAGRKAPPNGAIATILTPHPGLGSIRSPVAPGGGEDREPPEAIREYAPREVLTFGRAVGLDDHEVIVARAPGVNRARAYVVWDAQEQRAAIKVYVGDDEAAVNSARNALLGAIDPGRLPIVELAQRKRLSIELEVVRHPDFTEQAVKSWIAVVLADPREGLLGARVRRIGQALYDSDIYEACRRVPGVVAVPVLKVSFESLPAPWEIQAGARHSPALGSFFVLEPEHLFMHVMTEAL